MDLYPDLYSKAAALGHSILSNHPFLDGNKRTAFTCMDIFLQENGLMITADDDASEEAIRKVLRREFGDKDIAEWLRANTRPLTGEGGK